MKIMKFCSVTLKVVRNLSGGKRLSQIQMNRVFNEKSHLTEYFSPLSDYGTHFLVSGDIRRILLGIKL